MSELVHEPERRHVCAIGWESRELPIDDHLRRDGFTHYRVMVHEFDPVGTVRACDECGKTYVARRPYNNVFVNEWRPEGRLARWWRERSSRP